MKRKGSALWLPLVLVLAGCSGSSTSPMPTAPPVLTHLYIANDNTPGGIRQYTLPLTSVSTPNFTIAANNTVAIAIDSSGLGLAAGDFSGNLTYYPPPLTASSVPTAAFKNGTAPDNGQLQFLGGDLYAGSTATTVNIFDPPFTNASVVAGSATGAGLTGAVGTAFDASGNLYVSNAVSGGSNIFVFAPPYTGAPAVVTPAAAGTIYRKIAVSSTQLFVASVSGPTGTVDVYALPLTGSSAPAFSITTGVNTPEAVLLDSAGNLYVGNLSNATVTVYSPPFSAASTPTLSFLVSAGPFALFGMAMGP
ncbi:MAG TPA: hypothetical protein VKF82_09190 [Candidatus Eremiobacteraceae bacterium]|nr:hypothetical protein [Candidatus Eremiobacteraceae bacterium]